MEGEERAEWRKGGEQVEVMKIRDGVGEQEKGGMGEGSREGKEGRRK